MKLTEEAQYALSGFLIPILLFVVVAGYLVNRKFTRDDAAAKITIEEQVDLIPVKLFTGDSASTAIMYKDQVLIYPPHLGVSAIYEVELPDGGRRKAVLGPMILEVSDDVPKP